MTRLQRPCLGWVDPRTHERELCGVPAKGGRCPRHRLLIERYRRPNANRRGYDKQYRQDRAKLGLEHGDRVCSLRLPGCTYWADTADHVVPVALGGRRGPLRPACKHCNSVRGKRELARDVDDLAVAAEASSESPEGRPPESPDAPLMA